MNKKTNHTKQAFLFGKENYMLMLAGLAILFIGFALMAGGKSPDPHVFNDSEVFSFRRITLAPIVVMIGFIVEVVAIMRRPKSTEALVKQDADLKA